MNWRNPRYFDFLFLFSKRYLDFWYGDNNFNRETNGENRIIRALAPRLSVVFDVGANTGDYSQYILSLKPEVYIHCFEPDPEAFKKLSGRPVKANNLALAEKTARKDFFLGGRSTHNSFYDMDGSSRKISIHTETLDGYAEKEKVSHIDFLKIDTEGSEYSVLAGAKKMLEKKAIDFIQFEFSGAHVESRVFLKDFMNLLGGYGYDLYRIKPKSIEKIVWRPDKERFTLTNYIAINQNLPIPEGLNVSEEKF